VLGPTQPTPNPDPDPSHCPLTLTLTLTLTRCSGQHTTKGGALYPDEGSAHMSWHGNVLERLGGSRWVHTLTPTLTLT